MYYLKKGIKGKLGKVLGVLFSFFLLVEIAPSRATEHASVVQTAETINISNWVSGLVLMTIVGIVVFGGIKRIGKVTERLVPLMALLYVIGAIIIILINITKLPNSLALIFKHAFIPIAAVGGFAGSAVAQTIRWGTARGYIPMNQGWVRIL